MISLEQVQLLEEKVSKAIDYVSRVNAENAALVSERASLMQKLESTQKRIDELEVHILRFKEDQGRIEDGIIAALDRLSQFEEAFEKSLKDEKTSIRRAAPKLQEKPSDISENQQTADSTVPDTDSNHEFFEIKETSAERELDIF